MKERPFIHLGGRGAEDFITRGNVKYVKYNWTGLLYMLNQRFSLLLLALGVSGTSPVFIFIHILNCEYTCSINCQALLVRLG